MEGKLTKWVKVEKRLVLSVGTVLTALCVTAGATMAYFNDTEPLAGDFVSGKLGYFGYTGSGRAWRAEN